MDKVTVLCPNAHRVTISTSRHSLLSEVVDEACKRKGFDPKTHTLKHHERTLDLSLSIHLANLPRNSQLELVPCENKSDGTESDSKVSICLQLENGDRLTNDFLPDSTLEDVVNFHNVLDKDSGQANAEPVIVYLRREIIGTAEFKKTTLRRLGLNKGRAILRLMFRDSSSFGQQANVYIPSEKKEEPSKQSESNKEGVPWRPMRKEQDGISKFSLTKDVIGSVNREEVSTSPRAEISEPMETETKDEVKENIEKNAEKIIQDSDDTIKEESAMECDKETPESNLEQEEEEILSYLDGGGVIFKREAGKSLHVDLEDDFFEVTVHDAIRIQADLRRKVGLYDAEAALMTEAMRNVSKESEKLSLLNKHPKSVVRIQFPDLIILQGVFLSGQNIEDVVIFTRRYLQNPESKFFFLIPPTTKLDPAKSLLDSECVPSVLVRFISQDDPPTESWLKPEVLQQLSNKKGADKALKESGVVQISDKNGKVRTSTTDVLSDSAKPNKSPKVPETVPNSQSQEGSKAQGKSGVPKWFKPSGSKK